MQNMNESKLETYISFSSVKLAISAGIGPCNFFEEKFLRNTVYHSSVQHQLTSAMIYQKGKENTERRGV